MRLGLVTIVAAFLCVLSTSCEPGKKSDTEKERIDSLKIALDSAETGLLTLEKKYHSGLLTYKRYIKRKILYDKAYQEVSIQLGGLHRAYKLPGWALNLGLMEPNGILLDSTLSQETSAERPQEGFNSITLVYISSPDSARMWADSIAYTAGLAKADEYLIRSKKASSIKAAGGPGVTYLNYNLKPDDKDYLVSVQADEEGILTITATNMKQLNEKLSDYRSLKVRIDKKSQGKKK